MSTYDPRRSAAWQKLRAARIAEAAASPEPIICWRCEQPIDDLSPNAVDLGHIIDHALAEPGAPVRVALEHRACNRAAGMALSREITRRPRKLTAAWETSELGQPAQRLYDPEHSR